MPVNYKKAFQQYCNTQFPRITSHHCLFLSESIAFPRFHDIFHKILKFLSWWSFFQSVLLFVMLHFPWVPDAIFCFMVSFNSHVYLFQYPGYFSLQNFVKNCISTHTIIRVLQLFYVSDDYIASTCVRAFIGFQSR